MARDAACAHDGFLGCWHYADVLPLNVRVGEGPHGWWWCVFRGEGDFPGSALGGGGSYAEPNEAWSAASECLNRWRERQAVAA